MKRLNHEVMEEGLGVRRTLSINGYGERLEQEYPGGAINRLAVHYTIRTLLTSSTD
jgi:hypothetical protein